MQLPTVLIDCLEKLRIFASKDFHEEVANEMSYTCRRQGIDKVVQGVSFYCWHLPQESEQYEFAKELSDVMSQYVEPLEISPGDRPPQPEPQKERHFGFRVD